MTNRSIRKALALASLAAMFSQPAFCAASDARSAQPADLVLFHGTILTVDGKDSIAEALAVRGGKIVAIGTTQGILRLAGSKTRRIDLNGRTATPGLIDSHAHIADGGVGELYNVQLGDATTVAEAVNRVRKAVARLKPGAQGQAGWLQGAGCAPFHPQGPGLARSLGPAAQLQPRH